MVIVNNYIRIKRDTYNPNNISANNLRIGICIVIKSNTNYFKDTNLKKYVIQGKIQRYIDCKLKLL